MVDLALCEPHRLPAEQPAAAALAEVAPITAGIGGLR